LIRRVRKAGFTTAFIQKAILPQWWDVDCEDNYNLLAEIEFRVARFLDTSIAAVKDPQEPLTPPQYNFVRMRRIHDIEHDRLAPAIHTALRIASAVLRNLSPSTTYLPIPSDPIQLRDMLLSNEHSVTLEGLLSYLWKNGIPVIPIDVLPSPSFQGMTCFIEGRPVIALGHKHDAPGRSAFIIAHEIGHITSGHCNQGAIIVDEEDDFERSQDEHEADHYATKLFIGKNDVPKISSKEFKSIAEEAYQIELFLGINAGFTIFNWGKLNNDFTTAGRALKALYMHSGARLTVKEHLQKNISHDGVSESDQALINCIFEESL